MRLLRTDNTPTRSRGCRRSKPLATSYRASMSTGAAAGNESRRSVALRARSGSGDGLARTDGRARAGHASSQGSLVCSGTTWAGRLLGNSAGRGRKHATTQVPACRPDSEQDAGGRAKERSLAARWGSGARPSTGRPTVSRRALSQRWLAPHRHRSTVTAIPGSRTTSPRRRRVMARRAPTRPRSGVRRGRRSWRANRRSSQLNLQGVPPDRSRRAQPTNGRIPSARPGGPTRDRKPHEHDVTASLDRPRRRE
jgi:hypothetical protein